MEPYQVNDGAYLEPEAAQEDESGQTRANVTLCEGSKGTSLTQKLFTKAGLAKEIAGGLLEVACTLGLGAVHQIFEDEVVERVGIKGKHNAERTAKRHGYDDGEVTFGGRRIAIQRPRMREIEGKEIPLETYLWATERDVLNKTTYNQLLAGVSTRNYQRTLEPVIAPATAREAHRPRSISKSSISRRFIELTKQAWSSLMERDLRDIKPVVLMIDGLPVARQMLICAMVIDIDGHKHPVGLKQGATENTIVVKDLLSNLVDRGLDYSHGILVVIDGSKALAAGVRRVFGDKALIQRCVEHKVRNVESYLHEDERAWVSRTIRKAVKRTDPIRARRDLDALAKRLEETNIDAASSLREGLDELLTIHRLGVGQLLARTLRSTNAIESMNDIIGLRTRNVKHWKDGDMRLRWVAAAMLEAESQFRRVQGWAELPALSRALFHATDPEAKQRSQGGESDREIAA